MRNILEIFKRDVRRLWKNWVAMIVVAGVCIIPSLYAWFNIAANYDPYSNTQGVQIAVASEDRGADTELTGRLNAGDEILKNLRENDELGWVFVDRQEAISGVKAGKYYAAIVVPEDFSQSLISVLSGKIKRPEIEYYLNEKKNAIAPKVTDTGASTIAQEVNDTFLSIASASVQDTLKDAAASVSGGLERMEADLSKNLNEVSENLNAQENVLRQFQNMSDDSEALISQSHKTMKSVRKACRDGEKALEESQQAVKSVRKSVAEFSFAMNSAVSLGQNTLGDLGAQTGIYLGKLNETIQSASSSISTALNNLDKLLDINRQMIEELNRLNNAHPSQQTEALIKKLEQQTAYYEKILQNLGAGNESISSAAGTVDKLYGDLSDVLKENQNQLSAIHGDFTQSVIPTLQQVLDSVSAQTGKLSGILSAVGPVTREIDGILDSLEDTLDHTDTALDGTQAALTKLQADLDKVSGDLNILKSTAAYEALLAKLNAGSDDGTDFMTSPVKLKTESLYPVENYGSAMTPFYTNLAIWVSGIVLIAIFKLEVDRDEKLKNLTAAQSYFGRWMLFIAVGLVQALIICLGDLWILKVQCEHVGAFILSGLFASFIYINLIYALSITFKHIGKALCVILVILQIPGSAGTYPIEMTPEFFQRIHPLLPFTYGINAMREAVAGMYGSDFAKYIGMLAVYLPLALLIGLGVRPLLLNLNRMFDKKLEETGLMICEEDGLTAERIRLSTVVKILSGQEQFRKLAYIKAGKFEKKYNRRKNLGFLLIFLLPTVFLTLMFSVSSKMVALVLWIASIIGIAVYLICLEFIHENLQRKLRFSEKTQEELLKAVKLMPEKLEPEKLVSEKLTSEKETAEGGEQA